MGNKRFSCWCCPPLHDSLLSQSAALRRSFDSVRHTPYKLTDSLKPPSPGALKLQHLGLNLQPVQGYGRKGGRGAGRERQWAGYFREPWPTAVTHFSPRSLRLSPSFCPLASITSVHSASCVWKVCWPSVFCSFFWPCFPFFLINLLPVTLAHFLKYVLTTNRWSVCISCML